MPEGRGTEALPDHRGAHRPCLPSYGHMVSDDDSPDITAPVISSHRTFNAIPGCIDHYG